MSSGPAISNAVDDSSRDELALFDDDDPFNMPPPLPPLSPQRDDDGTNQDGGDQDAGEEGKKEENKKRRVKRSPRPKLDEVRLCNDRGIPALRHLCDDIKFKGKGHEASDLKLLVQRYEYWAHRLFPKFPFADVVDQVENLGNKKLVQNCIKRIRRGEDDTVEDENRSDSELAQNNAPQDNEIQSQVPATPGTNNIQTFGMQVEARDQMVILTPEQQERMRLNKERALAKRKAAQEKQAEQDNTQTNDQSGATEDAAQSTEDDGIAKDDVFTTGNLEMENHSSGVQANDIEMEDHNTLDENVRPSPSDDGLESRSGVEANGENVDSSSMVSTKENVDDEDIEMANVEPAAGLDSGDDIAQNEESVPEVNDRNINETTEGNDLLGSVNDLPPNEDDADLVTVPLMEETPTSCSHNDEALRQEGPQETLDTRPTEQAPGENEPGEAQTSEMETEQ